MAEKIRKTAHTADGPVTVEMSKRMQEKHPHIRVVFDDPDEIVKRQVGGFVHFLREKAVVGLAVGFIIGQQAQAVIKQLVDSFISPVLNIIVGSKLQDRMLTIAGETFSWGKFAYVFINFLFILLSIYVIIKIFKLDKLDLPKDGAKKSKK